MTPPAALLRAFACALTGAVTVFALAIPAAAHAAQPAAANLDLTQPATDALTPATDRAQDALRAELGPRALVENDPASGTPRIVARLDGFLTPASDRAAADVALDYVRAHRDAFGLDAGDLATVELTSREAADGTVHLAWAQAADGIPNVDGGLEAAVDAKGRLINVTGGALPDPAGAATEPAIGAGRALEVALPGGAPAPPAGPARGAERRTEFLGGGEASLVRYRDGGTDRLGWRVLAADGSQAFYDAIVDARTGTLKRRVNRVRNASRIRHFGVNPRRELGSTVVSDVPASWLGTGPGLQGPYVHAVSDLTDHIKPGPGGTGYDPPTAQDEVLPTSQSGSDRMWTTSPVLGTPQFCTPSCSWSAINVGENREFTTAQVFWYLNTFRDHLAGAPIGFTGAGAFADDDPVVAQTLDGAATGPNAAHLSNANMLALPDGNPGLMQLYLFRPPTGTAGFYDGGMDAGLVYHEYTHGLSERLVTDAQGFGALIGAQPGAIAEGTSDFYAMDFLAETQPLAADTSAAGDVRLGKFLQPNVVRTEGLDCPVGTTSSPDCLPGGYTYDDFGSIDAVGPEPHADGEIWAQTLWSLRKALIAAHPSDGLERTRAYVTGGLRLSPEDPTFLDMRNAIVQAAVTAHGNQDWDLIWDVFAGRGMGWSASTEGPDDVTPYPAADEPAAPAAGDRGAVTGVVQDEGGAPVAGATIAVAGHDSGLSQSELSAPTGSDGRYAIGGVRPGHYPDVYVSKPGFEEATTGLTVVGTETKSINFAPLRRDYASIASGGAIAPGSALGYASAGCGAGQAIDDDKRTVWSTDADTGPKDLVVDLGRSLDVRAIRIDPRAGCGDPAAASLRTYELSVSDGPGQPYERVAGGVVGNPDARGYVSLPLVGDMTGRRLVKLTAIAPQSPNQGGDGPYMDVSELEVTGTPSPVTPTPTPTPAPTVTPVPTPVPTPSPSPEPRATSLAATKLKADRKGMVKVGMFFGDRAPAGSARLRLIVGKTAVGTVTLTVRPGRTVTKTLRLTTKGRRTIRPGKSRKVTVELRLPGGQKVKRTLTLARAKR